MSMYKYEQYEGLHAPKSTMCSLSTAELEKVIVLINSGHSAHHISSLTGHHTSTITCIWSKHCPHVPKSSGGCPSKLSSTDICLINSGKAENATHIAQTLQSITNQSLSHETIRTHLKNAGLKAVVQNKTPLPSQHHKHERMDFALSHRNWTIEDWKRVRWSDETKINRLGSDGQKWVWKSAGEALSDCLGEGTQKFGGGSLMMWGVMP